MGKSFTPKYRLEMDGVTPMAWTVKYHGQANEANLRTHVFGYAKSLELGGANQHISKALGHIPYPTGAKIVNQLTGHVVATWKAGMFQVY